MVLLLAFSGALVFVGAAEGGESHLGGEGGIDVEIGVVHGEKY